MTGGTTDLEAAAQTRDEIENAQICTEVPTGVAGAPTGATKVVTARHRQYPMTTADATLLPPPSPGSDIDALLTTTFSPLTLIDVSVNNAITQFYVPSQLYRAALG